MFTECPYCEHKAIPLWKKPFQNNTFKQQFKCENCGRLLVLSHRWIAIYIIMSIISQAIVALISFNYSLPMIFIGFSIFLMSTIPFFILFVPLRPYK